MQVNFGVSSQSFRIVAQEQVCIALFLLLLLFYSQCVLIQTNVAFTVHRTHSDVKSK